MDPRMKLNKISHPGRINMDPDSHRNEAFLTLVLAQLFVIYNTQSSVVLADSDIVVLMCFLVFLLLALLLLSLLLLLLNIE